MVPYDTEVVVVVAKEGREKKIDDDVNKFTEE